MTVTAAPRRKTSIKAVQNKLDTQCKNAEKIIYTEDVFFVKKTIYMRLKQLLHINGMHMLGSKVQQQ